MEDIENTPSVAGNSQLGSRSFHRLSQWIVPQRNKVHVAMFLLTLFMIPGALTALEPIDMESYELESPELTAQEIIDNEFATSEIILGFAVSVREPNMVGTSSIPIPARPDGTPDWSAFAQASEIIPSGRPWEGITSPNGGILNLSVLKELDVKHNVIQEHTLSQYMKPFVNDVTGLQTNGVMSVVDIFRGFMNNSSILTAPRITLSGTEPPLADWSDCGILECLEFDDVNVTQAHIDLAAHRMAMADGSAFLRWISLDRGFVPDTASNVIGPAGGKLQSDGTWDGANWQKGRWSGSSTWLLVQLDRAALIENGWTTSWKDAHSEKSIKLDDGFQVGGYRFDSGSLVLHPPNYTAENCPVEENPCSAEWSYMDLEGRIRSYDDSSVTLLVGQGINVEVNRELQSSFGLIMLMGLVVIFLLYISLRRWSDVAIVGFALGGALLWMQGFIGHASNLFDWFGWDLLSRSQFSNLLPILVLALGIDDSLHALHRYKEERQAGKSPKESAQITLHRIGLAIMLTSVTTMAAFSANLFSDVAALRSFGIEAGFGILAAFLLTGMWTPLLRLSVDEWMEKKSMATTQDKTKHMVSVEKLQTVTKFCGKTPVAFWIALAALLLTIPASWAMSNLEGDFEVEDFLDESSDMAIGIDLVSHRFADEGEPAVLLMLGDVADPRVFASIQTVRENFDHLPEGIPDKMTREPDGQVDILAVDEMLELSVSMMIEDRLPYEQAGLNESECDFIGRFNLPDLDDRRCLLFLYGYISLFGINGTASLPSIPASLVGLYITPDVPLDHEKPWLDIHGQESQWSKMLIRFGITSPEDFPSMGPGLEEIRKDLMPLTNLSTGSWEGPGDSDDDDKPLSWVMVTGRPITRFVASESMQNEMQNGLILGSVFVFITLSIGFRSIRQALVALIPILLVVVWLYGLIWLFGYSLNIVTVTIATISLGVGIDYCIHVTERYREIRQRGETHESALIGVGGACALALVGSAASDIAGFSIIALSPMGLFSAFGIFSGAMIALSLIASMGMTTAALGILHRSENSEPMNS
ncbi:MAG TPA: hypothetical protein D7I06_09305 [Candidatus Poseidoniales archaeon]|nr:MAG TPA: hypothetical protein D7I06_09305 [Candidatus Poseidoniales archaeon]HII63790.1 MMPL family transporter [Candidatus Poseidoniaceae archaeon]